MRPMPSSPVREMEPAGLLQPGRVLHPGQPQSRDGAGRGNDFRPAHHATATNKKTKQPVQPAGLGSSALNLSADDDARQALSDWMTSKDNPFFARSLVNRY